MVRGTTLWLVVFAAMLLVGCASGGEKALAGTEWVLVSLRGSPLLEETQITLKFGDEWMSGLAGCNNYGGGPDSGRYVATKKGALEISEFAQTVRECHSPKGVMEQEKLYGEVLRSAKTYRIVNDRLEIRDATGETILVYDRKLDSDP